MRIAVIPMSNPLLQELDMDYEDDTTTTESDWLNSILGDQIKERTAKDDFFESLYGQRKIDTLMNIAAHRVYRRNYDLQIAVSGTEGTGKSLTSILLGMLETYKINALAKEDGVKLGLKYEINRNVIFGQADYNYIINFVTTIPQYSPFSLDEAIETMYSRDWNKKGQKKQNKIFTRIRKRNLTGYLNIPNFSELDSKFKFGRVFWWIHLFKRGKAGLFLKDPNPLNPDPFNTKLAKSVIDRYTANRYSVDDMIKALHNHVPNFNTWFKIPMLPQKFIDQYDDLANEFSPEEQQRKEESATQKLDRILKQGIIDLFQTGNFKPADLAKRYEVSEYKVRQIIKEAREGNKPEVKKVDEDA